MSRRNLTYVVLVLASVVVSACSQPMAPTNSDTSCRIGTNGSSGFKCEAE